MREKITVADLREALDGVDGDRGVYMVSQGAIDDLLGVTKTEIEWNTGETEEVVKLLGP